MTDSEISNLLFLRDEPILSDLVMVFGAASEEDMLRRTRRGVEIYRTELVPRLLISGGGILALKQPETLRMAELARSFGVPDVNLLIESQSNSTFGNAKGSLTLLRERGLLSQITTIILVSSEWHMRRVLCTMRKVFPERIGFLCCPTLEGCTRENWSGSSECHAEILQELMIFQAFEDAGLYQNPERLVSP